MSTAKRIARAVLPEKVRRSLSQRHRGGVFRQAMQQFQRDPRIAMKSDSAVLERLVYGWGNETFSALPEYLIACLDSASKCKGPILECGSGLSTLLVGAIAQQNGKRVWTLEHHDEWGERVRSQLEAFSIDSVSLCVSPFKNHGEFDWYDPPLVEMPDDFTLVICDGPPGDTRGGRYGMLPVMRERLSPGCTILLDDAWREEERSIAAQWAEELGTDFTQHGTAKPYIELGVRAE